MSHRAARLFKESVTASIHADLQPFQSIVDAHQYQLVSGAARFSRDLFQLCDGFIRHVTTSATSSTEMVERWLSRCANEPENPTGICCTMTTGGSPFGSLGIMRVSASTPPVDEPIRISFCPLSPLHGLDGKIMSGVCLVSAPSSSMSSPYSLRRCSAPNDTLCRQGRECFRNAPDRVCH